MQKNWLVMQDDETIVKKFVDELNISELTAKILIHRKIIDVEDARIFLDPENRQEFNDPFLMKDISIAVERIKKAIESQEKIVIYGDYDVDGMSSTALMIRALRNLNADVEFYIPARSEGYGFNVKALKKIVERGAKLLISVDCGIANAKEIEEVKNDLDIIVTDHHLTQEPINNAVAVIDPHQNGCNYPDKNLCGAGVAFKLCQALNQKINGVDYKNYFVDLDIVALATVADIVPLVGENRKIVYHGLKQMESTKNIGLQALIKIANINDKKLNTSHLGYRIAPRLNATGRLATASRGVKLLTTENDLEAEKIAEELEKENDERKEIERRIIVEANEKYHELRKKFGGDLSSIVVASDKWHPGIIGLAASKLLERYYLPSIVIAIQGDEARGSCRSISALHIKETLDHFSNYFVQYGGHSAAAGFTIKTCNIEKFSREFDRYVKEFLNDGNFLPFQMVDAIVNPTELTIKLADEMEMLAPFGVENPAPIFGCRNIKGIYPKVIGQERNHLNFFVKSDGKTPDIRAVAWNKAEFATLLESELIDITFAPERNEFNGNVSVQCMVKSIDPSKTNGLFPNREAMINFYKFFRLSASKNEFNNYNISQLNLKFKNSPLANKNSKLNSAYTMLCAIRVFEELGIINFDVDGTNYIMPELTKKLDLNESRFWRING